VTKEKYHAVVFDLLTALLDSWSLWNTVAGSEGVGFDWRTRYLQLTYDAGSYRSYEGIIKEAAHEVGLLEGSAEELIRRWGELEPWPETTEVIRALLEKVPVAVVTNASVALGNIAVTRIGVAIPIVITAEEAGYYKPQQHPYRMALHRLGCEPESVLFVAGSAADVPGASALGMSVFWHNRMHLSPLEPGVQPRYISDSLWPILELV
jgi:2-haloalkanoic acid dehalogenase type II